ENPRKRVFSSETPGKAAPRPQTPGNPRAFSDLAPGALEMRVKEGSKIRNLLGFAAARMELPATRRIVFSGCGRAVTKTITCAEILKRRSDGLHQLTRLRYRGLREVWESRTPLTVHKNVPAVSILLSKDPLDPGQPGPAPSALGTVPSGVSILPPSPPFSDCPLLGPRPPLWGRSLPGSLSSLLLLPSLTVPSSARALPSRDRPLRVPHPPISSLL
uniref:DNA/RNA-binding protein Alba-like domain-containing protein n=1 Tax=Ornithorhynchus anatinus TaxID=9258 RepID=A0A6I8NAB5_ORNAN